MRLFCNGGFLFSLVGGVVCLLFSTSKKMNVNTMNLAVHYS